MQTYEGNAGPYEKFNNTTCTAEIKKKGEKLININSVRDIHVWKGLLEIRSTIHIYQFGYEEFDEINLKNFKKSEKRSKNENTRLNNSKRSQNNERK